MKTNKTFKGFTLVELMIVIVILGILMAAILPRLTGGQARSRDMARKSDLNSISQVMENFYGDHGRYPGINNTKKCLTSVLINNGSTNDDLAPYFKGGEVITPSSNKQTIGTVDTGCTANNAGAYWYKPISANGVKRSGFVLATSVDIEGTKNANFTAVQSLDTLNKVESYLATPTGTMDCYIITSQ